MGRNWNSLDHELPKGRNWVCAPTAKASGPALHRHLENHLPDEEGASLALPTWPCAFSGELIPACSGHFLSATYARTHAVCRLTWDWDQVGTVNTRRIRTMCSFPGGGEMVGQAEPQRDQATYPKGPGVSSLLSGDPTRSCSLSPPSTPLHAPRPHGLPPAVHAVSFLALCWRTLELAKLTEALHRQVQNSSLSRCLVKTE